MKSLQELENNNIKEKILSLIKELQIKVSEINKTIEKTLTK